MARRLRLLAGGEMYHVIQRCRHERPELMPAGPTEAACWLYAEGAAVRVAAGRSV